MEFLLDKSIGAQLKFASVQLRVCSQTPNLDAELLLTHVLGSTREKLLLNSNDGLSEEKISEFHTLIELRKKYSVAAITGRKGFWKSEFVVSKNILIPRPDTETIVAAVLSRYGKHRRSLRILELGTGSGCIIISLLNEYRNAIGFGFEKSNAAFRLTRINCHRHGLQSRLRLYHSDFNRVPAILRGKVDIIVSNPPYIKRADLPTLQTEVRSEPRLALDGGFNGILPYFAILKLAKKILNPGGEVFLEVGDYWKDSMLSLHNSAFRISGRFYDLSGFQRVVTLKQQGSVLQ
ncbi:protein-(glutamine-N5) methyltransferase, release factor-specific [Neorickettsia helminthoeca str. Oregon]|uniref:peptide chain release factor N(5)-glutamine methyltransferase n=1 Tax=Neorickettsia helminthoeca str. Oregon TaxID=1286528 RepID=X5H3G1_9RICK|nr:peptide chain release factor N(5)-glutamine methyltransferase [Neorickettsia helminthoeca]AHX11086.1 protein-(glutamine-N5) methyltransferase, release factor-specific [Neorickettsia helminthoeca str. Oregon]